MEKEKPKFGFKDIVKITLGAGAILGGLYLGYNKIKYGQAFLDENIPDQKLLPEPLKRCFIDYDNRKPIEKRLDEIENLMRNSESIEFNLGLMLICATLERLLKNKIIKEFKEINLKEHRGIVRKAALLKKEHITQEEYDKIKEITNNIRNPLFHGEFENIPNEEALNTFVFVKNMAYKFGVGEI